MASIKIYFGEEIRRLILEDSDLSIRAIRQKILKLFPSLSENNQIWNLKWKDEDNDLVTLTEDYELVEVLQKHQNSTVLRLWVVLLSSKTEQNPNELISTLVGQGISFLNHLNEQQNENSFSQPIRCFPVTQEKQEHFHNNNNNNNNNSNNNNFIGDCFNMLASATCDVTGVKLFPGKGWYHLKGSDYDICEAAFKDLPFDQKVLYIEVVKPEDLFQENFLSFNQQQQESSTRTSSSKASSQTSSTTTSSQPTTTSSQTSTSSQINDETELVNQLQQAGFSDINACVNAIRESKGDLNLAALTLLRSNNSK